MTRPGRRRQAWLAGMLVMGLAGVITAQNRPSRDGGGDWPGWRGPNRDAISRENGLLREWPTGGPPLAWKTNGLGGGLSSLSIAGGKIFTMGDRGGAQYATAVSQTDGTQVWSARIGPPHIEDYGGPRSTPTLDGDRVYVLGTDSDVVCLDAATGREFWRRNLMRDFGARMPGWKFAESPLVDGNRVVVSPGARSALLVALDKMTGKDVWRTAAPSLGSRGLDEAGYSSVVISNGAGVRQYVQLTARGVVGVRAEDGKFLWGYNRIANDTATIPTPIVKDDYVFTSSGYQTGAALLKLVRTGDGVSAQEVYFLEPRVFQNHHGGMVLVGDHVYAGNGHNRGYPICIELATGRVRWGGDIRNSGSGSAAVVYADGNLYFRYQNGVVVLIEATPEGYREKGSFTIPGVNHPSWSHMVVVGGKLYVREQDTLYCYNLRG